MTQQEINNSMILEMVERGVLYGHKKSKTHPKMKQYIAVSRNEIDLFKPEAVMAGLKQAIEFWKTIIENKGMLLMVGTAPHARETVKKYAEEYGFPYVTKRWLGGTLTNSKIIKERIAYYQNLRQKQERKELEKYTKKEQLQFGRELKKLGEKFDGLLRYERIPDALFVIDAGLHHTAIREATRIHVPIIAVVDNNDNPEKITYPIIANDHSRSSIEWVMQKIEEGIKKHDV